MSVFEAIRALCRANVVMPALIVRLAVAKARLTTLEALLWLRGVSRRG